MNGITSVSSVITQPCFGLFKRNDKWHQVKCVRFIQETGGVRKNLIQFPDRSELTVASDLISFDGRRKRFIAHPDYKPE